MRRSPAMTVMIRAAEKAGRAVIRDFGEVEQLQASQRGPKDFVAKAEAKSDEVIREILQQARPRFGLSHYATSRGSGTAGGAGRSIPICLASQEMPISVTRVVRWYCMQIGRAHV